MVREAVATGDAVCQIADGIKFMKALNVLPETGTRGRYVEWLTCSAG
jgi:hypothetical protein